MKITKHRTPPDPTIWEYDTEECMVAFGGDLVTTRAKLEGYSADSIMETYEPLQVQSEVTGKILTFEVSHTVDDTELVYVVSKKYNEPSEVQQFGHLNLVILL